MRIVSWNSHQKFREKIALFSPDSTDVLIVQECENTETAAKAYENAGWKYVWVGDNICLLYTSPSPRDRQKSRMPSSA